MDNPIEMFETWFAIANDRLDVSTPNAMTLATVNGKGKPSARIVLLKGFSNKGFVFYSNFRSNKGDDLKVNPQAALVFFWPEMSRQVRIEGIVSRVSDKTADDYFATRDRGSQIGAWASHQSTVIMDGDLDSIVRSYTRAFNGLKVHRPPYWGGYILKPSSIEFWEGKLDRLHDRKLFTDTTEGWLIETLAP